MTSNPKRKLGDIITVSDAIDHLQKVNPQIFNQDVYRQHRNLITHYFNPPYSMELSEHFGFPRTQGGTT
jgi:hypothetical protein